MDKKMVVWMIVAICLVVVGCFIFGGAMMALNWDFAKLSTVKYETNEYEISEQFKNISVVTDTADIVLVPAEKASVVCYEQINAKHAVSVKDGTLVIEVVDRTKWYERIGFHFGTSKITVYIPRAEYGTLSIKSSTGDVNIPMDYKFESMEISESTGNVTSYASVSGSMKIRTSTGDIRIEKASVGSLDLAVSTGRMTVSDVTCAGDIKLKVSTGKTVVTNVTCKNLTTSGNTGDLSLNYVIATQNFFIERTTGDVKFDRCDAAEMIVKTDTGDVIGTLLSEKVFLCRTDTGRVDVPKTTTGGKCDVATDTGNIRLSIVQE